VGNQKRFCHLSPNDSPPFPSHVFPLTASFPAFPRSIKKSPFLPLCQRGNTHRHSGTQFPAGFLLPLHASPPSRFTPSAFGSVRKTGTNGSGGLGKDATVPLVIPLRFLFSSHAFSNHVQIRCTFFIFFLPSLTLNVSPPSQQDTIDFLLLTLRPYSS
jgi:hypothetical protein